MISTVINLRRLIIFSSFLFVLLAFFILLPKSAQAGNSLDPNPGYGWTNVFSTSSDCVSSGKSNVTVILRSDSSFEDAYGTVSQLLTMTIRTINGDNFVYAQTRVGFVFTSTCNFEPENHYIEIVSAEAGNRLRLSTKFAVEDPNSFKEKLITIHAHKVGVGFGHFSVNHASPADGVWFNYNNPTLILNGNSAGNHVGGDFNSTSIKRVNLEVQGPMGIIKSEFNNGWLFGPINLGPQTFSVDGLYSWGAFVTANGNTVSNSVSSFSNWWAFGIDTQLPTANCSISPDGPGLAHFSTSTVTTTLSPTDPAPSSGIPEGELQVSTDGGNFTTISTQTLGTYDHTVFAGHVYEFRYKVRDGTIDSSGSTANSWSGYSPCGTVEIDDWPGQDLIIYYQENPVGTFNKFQILSSHKPPSTLGAREYVTDTDVFLHGSVKNIGRRIKKAKSTNKKLLKIISLLRFMTVEIMID